MTPKTKGSALLSTIFESSNTDDNKEGTNDKGAALSNLFNVSTSLPDRPNIVAPEAFLSNSKTSKTNKSEGKESKIVKGGKKRMRKKKLEEHRAASTISADGTNSDSISDNKDTETKSTNLDVRESKKGTDEKVESKKENAKERTIFVGNLPLTISRKELASIFKSCGNVESSRLRSIAATGVKLPPQKKGNQKLMRKVCANTNLVDTSAKKTAQGYVVFAEKESIAKALEMNNTIVTLTDLKIRLRIDTAEPTIDSSRTVFVGNLPYDAEEEDLYLHFSKQTKEEAEKDIEKSIVERVRVVRDPTTLQCKGFGYVLFHRRESVVEGLQLHDSTFRNRKIRVQICGKRYKGKRGQDSNNSGNKNSTFEGMRSTTAAAKRILGKRKKDGNTNGKIFEKDKKRRTYSEKNAAGYNAKKKKTVDGMSKRAATESKIGKRVKKLQKRMAKGMGKTKR